MPSMENRITHIRGRKIRHLHTERQEGEGVAYWVKKQILGLISLIICIILSIPGVPGPGIVFFALTLLLLDYPGKKRLFNYLRYKRWFRIARILIWRRMGVFMVLPES